MKNVLVTGATGFIGQQVCRELVRNGAQILATGRSSSALKTLQLDLHHDSGTGVCEIEMLDLQSTEQLVEFSAKHSAVTHLVHLACPVPGHNGDSSELFSRAEQIFQKSFHLITQLNNLRHVTFLSSVSLYDHTVSSRLSESSPFPPKPGAYAYHKQLCEQRLEWLGDRSDWSLAVLRPCQVFGPGEPHGRGLSQMIRSAAEDGIISLNNGGEDARDFIYVGDVARAIARVAQNNISGTFNVSSGKSMTMREIAVALQQCFPEPPRIDIQPQTREPNGWVYDNTKLKNLLGEEPAIPIEECLKLCVTAELDRRKAA